MRTLTKLVGELEEQGEQDYSLAYLIYQMPEEVVLVSCQDSGRDLQGLLLSIRDKGGKALGILHVKQSEGKVTIGFDTPLDPGNQYFEAANRAFSLIEKRLSQLQGKVVVA